MDEEALVDTMQLLIVPSTNLRPELECIIAVYAPYAPVAADPGKPVAILLRHVVRLYFVVPLYCARPMRITELMADLVIQYK